MPTRNQAAFLPAAVASVLQQTEGAAADLELVVVDGASTDSTPALLADLAQRHPGRIRWLSEPDTGPADAVNKAVALAAAPIIGWLNSDDLYSAGAAARAVLALQQHPDWVMVYGEAEHVDVQGHSLGRYPTRKPDTPLAAWADGCHICQPTAFFRRDVFLAQGGLDTGLRTAFDYDFWLRLQRACPGRIGHLPVLQALSRLHAQGITLRLREQVALEGMRVVHRHLGSAPEHWLLTHFSEALAACPFDADVEAVRAHLQVLIVQAAAWTAPGGTDHLKQQLRAHRAWQLARPDLVTEVYADGWAGPELTLRLRQRSPKPYRSLRLRGRHVAPTGALRLYLYGPGGQGRGGWAAPGPFAVTLPLTSQAGELCSLTLRSDTWFVPADHEAGSDDLRRLAFVLDAVELL